MKSLAVVAAAAVVRASTEFEVIVTQTSYTDPKCTEKLFSYDFSMHQNECVKNREDRYLMSTCTKDGLITEAFYPIDDPECKGKPYKRFKLIHNECRKTEEFGQVFYRRETFKGHCAAAKRCDLGWQCEEGWKLMDYEEGAHPKCEPDATKKTCANDYSGEWLKGQCTPPALANDGDDCPGAWAKSHEGSRVQQCNYPEAVCPGCGYKVTSGKMKCGGECRRKKYRIRDSEDLACDCAKQCEAENTMAWEAQPNGRGKKGGKASCFCFTDAGDKDNDSFVRVKKIVEAGEGEEGFWLSTDANGAISDVE